MRPVRLTWRRRIERVESQGKPPLRSCRLDRGLTRKIEEIRLNSGDQTMRSTLLMYEQVLWSIRFPKTPHQSHSISCSHRCSLLLSVEDRLPSHVHPHRTPSLFGCNMPIILRRLESCYLVVGDCLVPGLMEGEALDQLAPDGPFQLEEIELR